MIDLTALLKKSLGNRKGADEPDTSKAKSAAASGAKAASKPAARKSPAAKAGTAAKPARKRA